MCVAAFSQSTTVTLYATGTATSHTTGWVSNTGIYTEPAIRSSFAGTKPRGYAVFNLAGLPPAATITSCTIGYNVAAMTIGTAATCKTFGFSGDLSTLTGTPAVMYADMIAGTQISAVNYGATTGNHTIATTAAGNTYLASQFGSKVSISWTCSAGTTNYTTITGETGTAATTGAHAPYMTITYNCTGVSGVTATALPTPICAGNTVTLTAGGTGTTSYSWSGPGGYSSTVMNPTFTAATTSAGVYTLTAYNSGGCPTTVTTNALVVNPTPGAISGPSSICSNDSVVLTDALGGGAWSSTNTAAATISVTGLLKGVAAGTTTISYVIPGTGCYTTLVETIRPIPAGITGPSTVCPGGPTITLNDVTLGGTWSSTPATIGTINTTSGLFTSGTSGTATITYTSTVNCLATTVVTVLPLPLPISGQLKECSGSSVTLTDATLGGGTWSSSNIPVATVDSITGIVTGAATGTTVISFVTSCGYITAIDTSVAVPAPIVGRDSTCVGSYTTFADIPTGGTWTSSSSAIATVLPGSGIITGVAAGTAVITYTIPPGCSAIAVVHVLPLPPAIGGITHLCPGTTTGLFDGVTGGTWSSLEPFVASVGATTGVVTGIMADTADIVYTDAQGCKTMTTITVNPLPAPIVGGITVCATSLDTVYDATLGGVWSSGSTGVATVSPTGVVTTISGGVAIIKYTLPLTGCAVSKSFTVNPLPAPIVTYNAGDNTFYTDTFYTSYQWYCTVQNLIPGATVYKTAGLYDGNYWVVVTDTNGCTGESALFAYNTAMGVASHNNTLLRIYPNPANQVVYIESTIRVRAEITGIDGKMELRQAGAKEINISTLANGLYFISLYNDIGERLMVQKLIKE